MEMIACHDCGNPVSLSARQCPTCGSKDLAGPYRPGRKHRVEYRNDRNLAATSLSLGLLGACYGFATSASTIGAILATLGYALAGLTLGVPIGVMINVLRN